MKILVVDDSRLSLLVAESHLKNIPEIDEIILCQDSLNAMDIINEKAVDIIVLDVVMPKIDGYELLRRLRGDHQYDDVPIIIFTSLTGDENLKKCFDLGASDYVNVPLRPVEFTARIKAAIDARNKSLNLKKTLIQFWKQNNELKEANRKIEEATFQLISRDKMAAIGQLAAGVAHEINNPLGYVSSNCETIQKYIIRLLDYYHIVEPIVEEGANSADLQLAARFKEALGYKNRLKVPLIVEELSGILSDTHDGLRRVGTIIQSLRTFARTVNEDELGGFMLDEIIEQVLVISYNEVKHAAQVTVDIPKNICIYCDKVSTGQVFLNMIINAVQAIHSQKRPELGNIWIRAEVRDKTVLLTIEDDGPGIAPEILDKLFDPFFTTKDVGQGTGLGLSISYDIIRKINGNISVDSTVGKGTCFTISLPLYQPAECQ